MVYPCDDCGRGGPAPTFRLVLLPAHWIRQLHLYTEWEWVPFTEPAENPSKIIKFHLVAMQ